VNSQPIAGQCGSTLVHSPAREKATIGAKGQAREQPPGLVPRSTAHGARKRKQQAQGNPRQQIKQLPAEIQRRSLETESGRQDATALKRE
jgi:hypothetical protein